ncbi:MAG: protein kinase [archaeon]|nr:protein kinase [archaeon]
MVDLRNNPHLTRIPRSLGHLGSEITQEIILDAFSSPTEETYRMLPRWRLFTVIRFKLVHDGSSAQLDLAQFFDSVTGVLNLRGANLTTEQAEALPLYEPLWWRVQQIDLSDNPKLTQIPTCLGFLDPAVTRRITIDVAPLISSMRPFARSAEAMIGYARGLLEGELILLNQVKLMVVGRAAVGKTSLVRALYGQRFDSAVVSTDGIDLGEFVEQGVRFATWDFGGQKVDRFTHQLFLADNALYLLLFKLTDRPEESLKELRFWLNSVLSRSTANAAKVLLVGTHADKSSSNASAAMILSTLRKDYGAEVISQEQVYVVSPLAGRETSIKTLRSAIFAAAQSINVRAPPEYGAVQQCLEGLQRKPPVLGYNEAVFLLTARLRSESERIGEILKILDYLGTVCVFEQPQSVSGGVVVLRPQWVATLLATIVTTKHRLVRMESGIISHLALTQEAWRDTTLFPTMWHGDLIKLLEGLEVLFEVPSSGHDEGDRCYFVPCMLREEPPDLSFYLPRLVAKRSEWRLRRTVCLHSGSVPVGVMPPILIAMLRECQLVARWQQGCVGRLLARDGKQEVWVQLSRSQASDIEVVVFGNCCRQVTSLLRRVISMLVQRLTQFYHLPHAIKLACPECSSHDATAASWFDQSQVLQHAVVGDQAELRCEPRGFHGLRDVRLDRLAPELLLLDFKLQERFSFDYQKLRVIKELGKGAFGQVLLMADGSHISTPTCSFSSRSPHGTEPSKYAVKILRDLSKGDGAATKETARERMVAFHQEFVGEVCLMSSLTHPNVVKLLGICTEPLAMVMEVVGGGDLYGQINDPFGFISSVFGFVQTVKKELSFFSLYMPNFRNVFLLRSRLPTTKQERLLTKCQELLESELVQDDLFREHGVVGWIEQQYSEGLRDPPLLMLESQPLDECYDIKEEDWKVAPLEEIADGGWAKAQKKFADWQEAVNAVGLGQEAGSIASAFCAAVERLYRDSKRREAHGWMTAMEDELQQVLKKHAGVLAPIDWVVRLKLATDIARGMVYLHELSPPMVHRDLKSPNIFLMRPLVGYPREDPLELAKPLAKVGDFGLSLRISSGHELQILSEHREENDPLLNINPTWAAPEILNGAKYTTMVDVYAMGIILWELLVRAHPFEETSMDTLKWHVLNGGRPLIPDAFASNPEHADYIALMRTCLLQNPGDRPSMREVYDALREMCNAHNQKLYQAVELLPERHHHDEEEQSRALPSAKPSVATCHALFERSPASAQAGPSAPAEPGNRCHLCQKTFGKVLNRKRQCKRCRRAVCKDCMKYCCSEPAPQESGSVSSAAEESIVADKISCMISPSSCRETLWMGFESGLVGLSELSREVPSEQLEVVLSTAADSHPMRVNAIAHQPNASGDQEAADSGGFVWTGSEDGTLSVWSARTTTSDDYALEAPMLTGMLRWMKPGKKSWMRRSWFQLEYGRLSWYTKRYEVTESGGIDCTREICAVVCSENENIISICLKASPIPLVLHFEDESGLMSTERLMQLREWFRQLTNVSIPADTQGRIVRVASQRLFNAGILALQHIDYDVWCVSSDFVVSQWSLSSAANSHGLHQSMNLHVKRCWQLDPSILLSARMRTVGGFVRVSACTLWLAVGNRWVLFDLSNPNADPQWTGIGGDSDDVASDKIAQAIVVIRRSGEQEIWTCDHSGKVAVWQADHPGEVLSTSTSTSADLAGGLMRPRRLGELLLDGWEEEREGLPFCLVQASQDQVWAGTSSGCVMAFDVGSRQLVPSSAQPLCSSHPLVHIRSVYALTCMPLSTPSPQPADRLQSVVWSASRDRTLRRFVLI